MPKVAVLLSTYNGQLFLKDFLKSLCIQQFRDFDLIVRDDGSTDQTLSILDGFVKKLRIIYLKDKGNIGPAKSFIKLLIKAEYSYDIYMFADQDDWWECDKISRCVDYFCNTDIAVPTLYCTALELVDSNLQHLRYTSRPNKLSLNNALVENVATGCTIGLNSSAKKLILESIPHKYTMHDWWIYILLSSFGKVVFDKKPTIKYRQHNFNTIGGASNFFEKYKRRFVHFFKQEKRGVFLISDQAQAFLECYGHRMTDDVKEQVSLLLPSNKTLLNSLYLFLFSPFHRQKNIDSFILRVLFLLRRY